MYQSNSTTNIPRNGNKDGSFTRFLSSSAYTATDESTNFARVCRLLLDIGTDVLKEYFDRNIPREKLNEHLNSRKPKLNKLPCLREYQKRKLFPCNKTPSSSDFDICLLYALLRETCNIESPKNGWGKVPDKSDISPGAYIERIRQARNEVFGHAKRATLNHSEFQHHWGDISEAVIGLGGSDYKRIIDGLKVEPLDVSQLRINAQMERLLETRGKDDEYFVETRAFKEVETQLKQNGAIMILGNPGDGKTSSAWHIILKYIQNGYEVIVINDADQFAQKWHPSKKQIFFVDDCFGQSRAIPEKAENWRKLQNDLHHCIDRSKTYIIGTLRRLIYRELRDKLQGFELFGNYVDLSDASLKLTLCERQKIFHKYAGSESAYYDPLVLNTILTQETPIFPLSCRLFFSKKAPTQQSLKFFHNPVHQLKSDLAQLFTEDRLLFGSMILLLICENKLDAKEIIQIINRKPPDSIVGWLKSAFCLSRYFSSERFLLEKVERIKTLCHMPKDKTIADFQEGLNTLQDIYIQFIDGRYKFIHQSILETIGLILANHNVAFLLEQTSATFVQQRIRTLGVANDLQDICDETMIKLPEKHYDLLAHRLTDDVISGDADVVFQNPSVNDVLFCNVWLSHLKSIRRSELLRFIRSVDSKGFSLLFWVAKTGHVNLFNFCIDAEMPSSDAIHGACNGGNTERVKMLITKGANLNATDALGFTPLMRACQHRDISIVKLLLSAGASLNNDQENLGSPLHVACWNQNRELVRTLIEHGADTNITTSAGWPNIYFSSREDNKSAIKQLLKGIKCVSLQSNTNWTPLHLASGTTDGDIVRMLLTNGADVNRLTTQRWSPLYCAAVKRKYNTIGLLVNHGADVNHGSHFSVTVMHRICIDGQLEMVKFLKNHGANLDAKSDAGYTPLHCACEFGYKDIASFLVKNGADINAVSIGYKTPIALAGKNNHCDIVNMLEHLSMTSYEKK